MARVNSKFVILCSIIIVYLVARGFLFTGSNIVSYTNLFNPLFWLGTAIVSYLVTRFDIGPRQKNKFDIIQTIIIILIIYLMIYFSVGLITGYEKSPYSHEFITILKNIWSFVVICVAEEIVRYQLIKVSPKKGWAYVLITLLFIITDISFWSFSSNLKSNVDFFRYVSETILPLVVSNALYTYLCITSGFVSSSIYRVVNWLIVLLLPIYPSINWLIKTMIDIILVIITALYVNYVQLKGDRYLSKRQIKKESITSYIPYIIILIVLVCFISGTFKFQPIAVLSNSMVPEFARGDAVIMEKITQNDLKKIKKGTILYYSKEGSLIIHRVVSVNKKEDGSITYTTKGDNNNSEDPWEVAQDEVIGIVRFMVPYIGYPSVLMNDLLN